MQLFLFTLFNLELLFLFIVLLAKSNRDSLLPENSQMLAACNAHQLDFYVTLFIDSFIDKIVNNSFVLLKLLVVLHRLTSLKQWSL